MKLIEAKQAKEFAQTFLADKILQAAVNAVLDNCPECVEPTAYWITRPLDNFRKVESKCSECGWTGIENYDSYVDPSTFNYCPYCGTRIVEV
jgi:predicted RNA-binding Zn-ribbon protein involved in translation (DUF1610 family)